jgi:hypothetical protein
MNHPFDRRKVAVIDLAPGDRIEIAGKRGTFLGYYQIKNFPNVIEWVKDGTLETAVTVWTQGGILVSTEDDKDSADIAAWEEELS